MRSRYQNGTSCDLLMRIISLFYTRERPTFNSYLGGVNPLHLIHFLKVILLQRGAIGQCGRVYHDSFMVIQLISPPVLEQKWSKAIGIF